MVEVLKSLSWMTEKNSLEKSISNMTTIAATKTTLSLVSMLSAVVGDRWWKIKIYINLDANMILAFLIMPLGPLTSMHAHGL